MKWINLKIIITVAICELLLVILETWSIYNCYYTDAECWPWFIPMIANFPASIAIFKLIGFIYDLFNIKSYLIQTGLMACAFLIIGTLWWSLVLHSLYIFYKYTSVFVGDRHSPRRPNEYNDDDNGVELKL